MFKVRFGRLSLDCLRPSSWSAANSCMSLECRKIYKCTDFEQFYWNLSNIVISFMFLECRNIHEFTDFHQVFWKFSKAVNSCISCSKIHECTNFQHIFWNSQNQWIPVSFKWSKNAKIPPKNSKSSEFLYISCPLSLGKKCTGTHLLSFLSIFGYFFENQWVPVCFLVTHRG